MNKIPLSEYEKTDSYMSAMRHAFFWMIKLGISLSIFITVSAVAAAFINAFVNLAKPITIPLGVLLGLVASIFGFAFGGKAVQSFNESDPPPRTDLDKTPDIHS